MDKNMFGDLKRVPIKEIWSREAHDFTPWLCENIDKLGKTLGMDLEVVQREASVGDFSSDILARDLGRDSLVIIENQYGVTNHDHLGKILTYAGGRNAKTIIWIAEDLRDEHRQAIDWLNQYTLSEIEFYGVVIEALQIDDSKPAYNFRLVAFPNEWRKGKVSPGEPKSERGELYRQFFQGLIDELREKHKFTSARLGQPQNWYSFSSGVCGYLYGANFASGGEARCEVYIDTGDQAANKEIFDKLIQKKDVIEKEMGTPLEWERLDERRASRIAIYCPGSISDDTDKLREIKEWMIEGLLKMKAVFPEHINPLIEAVGLGQ